MTISGPEKSPLAATGCLNSGPMTAREKAHALLDELPDSELDDVVRQLEDRHEVQDEPEMVELPEAWRYLPSGAPAPNWVAIGREARRGH